MGGMRGTADGVLSPKGRLKVPFPILQRRWPAWIFPQPWKRASTWRHGERRWNVRPPFANCFWRSQTQSLWRTRMRASLCTVDSRWAFTFAWSDFHHSAVEKTRNFTSRPGQAISEQRLWYGGAKWAERRLRWYFGGHLDLDRLTLTGKKSPVWRRSHWRRARA